jgi:hypothetical protein
VSHFSYPHTRRWDSFIDLRDGPGQGWSPSFFKPFPDQKARNKGRYGSPSLPPSTQNPLDFSTGDFSTGQNNGNFQKKGT